MHTRTHTGTRHTHTNTHTRTHARTENATHTHTPGNANCSKEAHTSAASVSLETRKTHFLYVLVVRCRGVPLAVAGLRSIVSISW